MNTKNIAITLLAALALSTAITACAGLQTQSKRGTSDEKLIEAESTAFAARSTAVAKSTARAIEIRKTPAFTATPVTPTATSTPHLTATAHAAQTATVIAIIEDDPIHIPIVITCTPARDNIYDNPVKDETGKQIIGCLH